MARRQSLVRMSIESDRRQAFEKLFATHYRAVRGYVLRRAPSSALEDVMSDVFLVAWRRLDSVADDPLPWLLGVARRVLANQHRAERRRGALTRRLQGRYRESGPDWEPPEMISGELAVALASLSVREREALLLVAWEGLEPGRAARAAGCSAATFRVRLHRARRRVADQLGEGTENRPHPRVTEETP
jgi:RNA polymerase sigma factor (sigma-70 family)